MKRINTATTTIQGSTILARDKAYYYDAHDKAHYYCYNAPGRNGH